MAQSLAFEAQVDEGSPPCDLDEHDLLHLRLLRLTVQLIELERLQPRGELEPVVRLLVIAGRQAVELLGFGEEQDGAGSVEGALRP